MALIQSKVWCLYWGKKETISRNSTTYKNILHNIWTSSPLQSHPTQSKQLQVVWNGQKGKYANYHWKELLETWSLCHESQVMDNQLPCISCLQLLQRSIWAQMSLGYSLIYTWSDNRLSNWINCQPYKKTIYYGVQDCFRRNKKESLTFWGTTWQRIIW